MNNRMKLFTIIIAVFLISGFVSFIFIHKENKLKQNDTILELSEGTTLSFILEKYGDPTEYLPVSEMVPVYKLSKGRKVALDFNKNMLVRITEILKDGTRMTVEW